MLHAISLSPAQHLLAGDGATAGVGGVIAVVVVGVDEARAVAREGALRVGLGADAGDVTGGGVSSTDAVASGPITGAHR
jgi:hypothetical protein